jgi:hypothetical protein
MKKLLFLALISLIAVGCASRNREVHDKIRAEAQKGNFEAAIALVKSDEFYPDKSSRLLKLMEGSLLHHLNGNYYQAMLALDLTKDLSDELFTVSVSKKVISAVANDNADNYYGETYERSMIRFYQAINHYSLFLKGEYESFKVEEKDDEGKIITVKEVPGKKLSDKERRFHLTAARSTLLEWNSLLDNYKSTSGGKPIYKDDLLAKIFGAFIHEQMGDAQNKNIALGLYKDAKKVLFRNFNVLPTYNKKSEEFVKNFDQFGTMEEAEVLKKYVEKTPHYINLEKFIDSQIVRLSNGKKPNSVFVLIENNFIAPKTAKKFEFPIPAASIPASLPGGDFMSFAGKVLNAAANAAPKIYFEMPEIPFIAAIDDQIINIKDSTGKVIATKNLATLNPLTDLAHFNLSENAISNYAKVGGRVVLKHVAALASAYAIYQKQKGTNETFAMMLAGGAYGAANKGIQMSEQADLRSWSMLPHMYSSTAFELAPGTYSVEYKYKDKVQNLGEIKVTKSDQAILVKQRIYQ